MPGIDNHQADLGGFGDGTQVFDTFAQCLFCYPALGTIGRNHHNRALGQFNRHGADVDPACAAIIAQKRDIVIENAA